MSICQPFIEGPLVTIEELADKDFTKAKLTGRIGSLLSVALLHEPKHITAFNSKCSSEHGKTLR